MNIKLLLEYTQSLNVLYVEDNIEIAHNGKDMLSHYFNSVDIAYDGEDGSQKYLDSLKQHHTSYDLVITDINMPKLNGVELSRLILRKRPEQAIVIMSAQEDSEYLMECINMGVSGFLSKPLDSKQLHMLLSRISQAIADRKFVVEHIQTLRNLNAKLENKNTQLNESNKLLENLTHIDPLTGLHNRRYFNIVLQRELKRARRLTKNITFMMLDIDFFKQYNDTYGHIQGDYALVSVSGILKNVLERPTDFIFRIGGEEFGILITDTSIQESKLLANKLCKAVEAYQIEHSGSEASKFLSVSIGVVFYCGSEIPNETEVVEAADKKLYEAKNQGRNQYVLHNTTS